MKKRSRRREYADEDVNLENHRDSRTFGKKWCRCQCAVNKHMWFAQLHFHFMSCFLPAGSTLTPRLAWKLRTCSCCCECVWPWPSPVVDLALIVSSSFIETKWSENYAQWPLASNTSLLPPLSSHSSLSSTLLSKLSIPPTCPLLLCCKLQFRFQEKIGPFVLAEGIMQQAGPTRHFNCHHTKAKFLFSQSLTA